MLKKSVENEKLLRVTERFFHIATVLLILLRVHVIIVKEAAMAILESKQ